MSGYTPLTQEERYQIYILKKAGHHQAEIAATRERYKSTASRELKRNQGLKGYGPQQAHSLALARRDREQRGRVLYSYIVTTARQIRLGCTTSKIFLQLLTSLPPPETHSSAV